MLLLLLSLKLLLQLELVELSMTLLLLLLLLVLVTDISVFPLCFSFKLIAVNVVALVGGVASVLIVTLSFLSMVRNKF
jgi:hypothetical protein